MSKGVQIAQLKRRSQVRWLGSENWVGLARNQLNIQLSLSSRAIHGGAYFSDVSGWNSIPISFPGPCEVTEWYRLHGFCLTITFCLNPWTTVPCIGKIMNAIQIYILAPLTFPSRKMALVLAVASALLLLASPSSALTTCPGFPGYCSEAFPGSVTTSILRTLPTWMPSYSLPHSSVLQCCLQ